MCTEPNTDKNKAFATLNKSYGIQNFEILSHCAHDSNHFQYTLLLVKTARFCLCLVYGVWPLATLNFIQKCKRSCSFNKP